MLPDDEYHEEETVQQQAGDGDDFCCVGGAKLSAFAVFCPSSKHEDGVEGDSESHQSEGEEVQNTRDDFAEVEAVDAQPAEEEAQDGGSHRGFGRGVGWGNGGCDLGDVSVCRGGVCCGGRDWERFGKGRC